MFCPNEIELHKKLVREELREQWDNRDGYYITGEKIDTKIISRTFLKKSSINHKFLNFAKSLKNDGHTIGILSNLTPETSTCVEKNLLKDFDYHFFSNSLIFFNSREFFENFNPFKKKGDFFGSKSNVSVLLSLCTLK